MPMSSLRLANLQLRPSHKRNPTTLEKYKKIDFKINAQRPSAKIKAHQYEEEHRIYNRYFT